MPILVFALAMPIVRTNRPILAFSAKTCSARERIFDFALLVRRVASGIGLPFDFLRWMLLTKPFLSRKASLTAER